MDTISRCSNGMTTEVFGSRLEKMFPNVHSVKMFVTNRTLLTISTFLICLSGCGFHLSQVGKVYFSYKSHAELTVSLAIRLDLPYFSLCFRFMDMIRKFEREGYYEVTNGINDESYYRIWSTLTLRDIFEGTPPIDELIMGCFIRDEKNLWIVNAYNKEKCLKRISSRKYVHRELICYKIDPFVTNQTIESLPVANSIEFYNSQFMIILNHTSMVRSLFMAAFVHIPGSSEYIDSTQNKLEVLSDDKEKGNFFLWYTTISLNKLPPPYDTWCETSLINSTGTEIGLTCMNQRLKKKFNKMFPLPHLYDYKSNYTLLSSHDLAVNASIANEVRDLRDVCVTKRVKCSLLHTQSHMSIKTGKRGSNIYVYVPITNTFVVDHTPNMILIDLVIYMCSCLGIWIGFSVWQMIKSVLRLSGGNRGRFLTENEFHALTLQLESNRIINEQLFEAVCTSKRKHFKSGTPAREHFYTYQRTSDGNKRKP